MRCSLCGAERPVVLLRPLGLRLCRACFVEYVEAKVEFALRIARASLPRLRHVVVAASGGKDSQLVLYVLARLAADEGFEITAVFIDEGLEPKNPRLRAVEQLAGSLKVPLVTVSFREAYGLTLADIAKAYASGRLRLRPCTVCGVIRRHLLNRVARELGADCLVTGHNLDDEIQGFVMNMLRGNLGAILKPALLVKSGHPKLVPRLKPCLFILDKEAMQYALLNRLPVAASRCPLVVHSMRHTIRRWLNAIERGRPGSKLRLLDARLKLAGALVSVERPMMECERCGEPSSRRICRACEVLEELARAMKGPGGGGEGSGEGSRRW